MKLTPRQTQAMLLLGDEGSLGASDSGWWPVLEPGSQVRGILDRLGRRGLVDREFHYNKIVYFLTRKGREVLAELEVKK